MRNPFGFFIELMQQPVWIPVWVFYLMMINFVSIGFWSEPLAKAIFMTFMLSAMLMMGLYSWFGFEKILGMGHVLWLPLLVYVFIGISTASGAFKVYLMILSISIMVSLGFDIVDSWKYFAGRKRT
ncbi:MAG: hypothetical protein V7722_09425 [Porticoccus sp.]